VWSTDQIRSLLEREHARPFEEPPLIRGLLLRLHAPQYLLIVLVDHIVGDWHSLQIIFDDFKALYHSRLSADTAPMPGCSAPEHAVWESQAWTASHFERDAVYWQQKWSEFGRDRIGFHHLPFSRPASSSSAGQCAMVHVDIDSCAAEAIRRTASEHRVSLYMFFLAAYAVVLHRYTGKARLSLWVHCSNRADRTTWRTVGYLVNTHLIGLDLSDNPLVRDFLRQVRNTVLEMIAHQRMPLQSLWNRTLCHPRFPDAGLLLDWDVACEDRAVPGSDVAIERATLPEIALPRWSALMVGAREHSGAISLTARFLVPQFDGLGVRQMVETLRTVASRMATEPDCSVSHIGTPPAIDVALRSPNPGGLEEFVACGFPEAVRGVRVSPVSPPLGGTREPADDRNISGAEPLT
jgi:hypothetical protein